MKVGKSIPTHRLVLGLFLILLFLLPFGCQSLIEQRKYLADDQSKGNTLQMTAGSVLNMLICPSGRVVSKRRLTNICEC